MPLNSPAVMIPERTREAFVQPLPGAIMNDAAQLQFFGHDVKAAAISCAKLLSCYNAVSFARSFHLPARLEAFAPVYPHSFKLLDGTRLMRTLSPATRSGLKGFAYYLGKARDEVLRLMETFGSGRVLTATDVAPAAEVTNAAACFAKLAVSDVLSIARRNGQENEIAQLSYLVALLDDVIEGRCPLWSNGNIIEVRADFMLRERRIEMTAVALILEQHRQEQVIVTNISRGGLGFKSAAAFVMGHNLEIKLLEPERLFKGQVVWRRGLNCGVQFDRLLADDDELLIPQIADELSRHES